MRIISGFHDYYDIGMQLGFDPKLPYRRVAETKPLDLSHPRQRDYSSRIDDVRHCVTFWGFAGKIYPAIQVPVTEPVKLDYTDSPHNYYGQRCKYVEHETKLVFGTGVGSLSEDPAMIYYAAHPLGHLLREFVFEKERHWSKQTIESLHLHPRKIEKYRQQLAATLKDLMQWADETLPAMFPTYKTAIFRFPVYIDDKRRKQAIELNPQLDKGFQKLMSPYQAFQELEMYVGNYLVQPTIQEPPISDKIKAEIHGFDQFSFRKEKRK
jgi:hypothetical protein